MYSSRTSTTRPVPPIVLIMSGLDLERLDHADDSGRM